MRTVDTQSVTREQVDASAARERYNLSRIAGIGALGLMLFIGYIEFFVKHH